MSDSIVLKPEEEKLIVFLRKLGDGKLTLIVRNGQPARIEKPLQTIVL